MNIYRCWYQGILGYGCRRGRGWMFVPELGQPDNRVHKQLDINDLVFMNNAVRRYEMQLEKRLNTRTLSRLMETLWIGRDRPRTIGGRLFTPQ